jgi:diacylglycerol kinase family enzyme
MHNLPVIVVNRNSSNFLKAISYLDDLGLDYKISKSKQESEDIILNMQRTNQKILIVCGGDGTVNTFINLIMKYNLANIIKLGVIPAGSANDFFRYMNGNLNIQEAIQNLKKPLNRTKKVDLILVNKYYFITGGGFGLPLEVVRDVLSMRNNFIGRFIKLILRGELYSFMAVYRVVKGYLGFKSRIMALCIMNQQFIGKRFFLSKTSINNDGFFEVCEIPRYSKIKDLKILYNLSKGEHVTRQISLKKIIVKSDKIIEFIGDGEIIANGNQFNFKIIPKAINFFY